MKRLFAPSLRPAMAAMVACLGIAIRQKVWGEGVQIELISLAVLVTPLGYMAWEAKKSGSKVSPVVFALGLLAFGGANNSTLSRWFLWAGVLALCPLLFRGEKPDPEPAGALGWLAPLPLALSSLLLWQALRFADFVVNAYFLVTCLALVESLWPWRARSRSAAVRRLTAGVLGLALTPMFLIRGGELHFLYATLPALLTALATLQAVVIGDLSGRAARRRVVRLFGPLVMIGFLLGGVLVVAEIYLRAVGHPLTKVPIPNQDSTWHQPNGIHHYQGPIFQGPAPNNTFRWNSWGLADFERTKAKKPGRRRILVIGDNPWRP